MPAAAPIPPVDLTARLALAPRTLQESEGYLERGRQSARAVEAAMPDDWGWAGKTVLDFGCGAGRVLRHFAPRAQECELWGSDISGPCIEWDRQNLSPPASFELHGEAPPLPFPDGKFDLVYALSVFTHITDQWAAWLLEIDRILAPGGLLLATFMGEGMCTAVTGESWDERNIGMNVYEAGQDWSVGGPMVMHSPWWLEAHWGRLFTIERLKPRGFHQDAAEGQDDHGVIVVRKGSATPSKAELERIDPAEPREATALHHDAMHLRAEVAHLRRSR